MAEEVKVCPDCAEEVKAAARICRFCGYKFDLFDVALVEQQHVSSAFAEETVEIIKQADATPDKSRGFKIVAVFVCTVFLIAYLIANANRTSEEATAEITTEAADAIVADAMDPSGNESSGVPIAGGWTYETSKDEVRNAEIKTATLVSNNTVFLSAPYDGGTKAEIMIRRHPEYGIDVILRASPAQIICDSYYGCSIDINIDGKTQKLAMTTPADHDSEYLFVRNSRSLLEKLKTSKKVVLEIPFYSNGNGQFQFTTSALNWTDK